MPFVCTGVVLAVEYMPQVTTTIVAHDLYALHPVAVVNFDGNSAVKRLVKSRPGRPTMTSSTLSARQQSNRPRADRWPDRCAAHLPSTSRVELRSRGIERVIASSARKVTAAFLGISASRIKDADERMRIPRRRWGHTLSNRFNRGEIRKGLARTSRSVPCAQPRHPLLLPVTNHGRPWLQCRKDARLVV